MTTRDEASPLALPHVGSAVSSHQRVVRAWRWMLTRGSVHVLLLLAMAGCIYPLVWMLMTSIKTDEELGQSDSWPSLPAFRDHSPYVRDAQPITPPEDVDASRFRAILPALRGLAESLTR